ncbi:putative PC-Esterase [Helianthus anomalus]
MISNIVFLDNTDVKKNMSIKTAYQKSVDTVLNWISKEVDTNKTQVVFRSFSPVHFRFAFIFYILNVNGRVCVGGGGGNGSGKPNILFMIRL